MAGRAEPHGTKWEFAGHWGWEAKVGKPAVGKQGSGEEVSYFLELEEERGSRTHKLQESKSSVPLFQEPGVILQSLTPSNHSPTHLAIDSLGFVCDTTVFLHRSAEGTQVTPSPTWQVQEQEQFFMRMVWQNCGRREGG